MNATDNQLAKALKLAVKLSAKQKPSPSDREKAVSAFKKVRLDLPPLCQLSAQLVFDYFLKRLRMQELGTPESPPWLGIQNLIESEFEEASMVAFQELRQDFRQLGTDDIIRLASSPKAFDEWSAVCKNETKTDAAAREQELIQKAMAIPPDLLSKPCLFWLVGKLALNKLPTCVLTIASICEPELQRCCIGLVLQKDVESQFPALWLERTGASGSDILRDAILAKGEVEDAFAKGIPVAVSRGGLNEAWFEFLRGWFREMPSTPTLQESAMARRLETVAALLRISVSTVDRTKALGIARGLAKSLRQQVSSPRQLETFWAPCVLEDIPALGQDALIADKAAEHLSIAFQKINSGSSPAEALFACMCNLGFQPVGESGKTVYYSPLEHEDTTGGLLPGTEVTVVAEGWRQGPRIVARAVVVAEKDQSRDFES